MGGTDEDGIQILAIHRSKRHGGTKDEMISNAGIRVRQSNGMSKGW